MITKPMTLSDDVAYIIESLNARGYRADVVGGAVRDHLLGRPSFDYDITTSATPDEVKQVFSSSKIVDTGIKHGTVTLVLDGGCYEITTWRLDGEYTDSRHPESVFFTASIEEDLARRDFTVNAIAYNPTDGYTDLYGGISDIELGVLRAVGDPYRRFGEDALRIMRAIRFSAALGFSLEDKTAEAAAALRNALLKVSEERIYAELNKLFAADHAFSAIKRYSEIFLTVMQELSGVELPRESAFASASPIIRMLSLFVLNTDSPIVSFSSALRRLKSDNATRLLGERALSAMLENSDITEYAALRMLYSVGEECARAAIRLGVLVGKYGDDTEAELDAAINSGKPYTISMLAVDGNDLKELGFSGKGIGERLSLLLDLCMRGECTNTREALFSYLRAD